MFGPHEVEVVDVVYLKRRSDKTSSLSEKASFLSPAFLSFLCNRVRANQIFEPSLAAKKGDLNGSERRHPF